MAYWDQYEHNDPKVTYILENIKTQEVEDLIVDEFCGCKCENECVPTKCLCIQRSGALYSFPKKFDFKNYTLDILDTNKPAYECNRNCKCINLVCGNKLVQFGPRKHLKMVGTSSSLKGLSLITTDQIEKGNFVCEYAGEVITQSEAQKRFKMYSEKGLIHNYIFCINENFGYNNEKTFIDPTYYGNIGRYINHSCESNCILIPIRIHDKIPKLCIFSNQMIRKDSEITFDYGEANSKQSKKKCLCGTVMCRKFLPFDILTEDL